MADADGTISFSGEGFTRFFGSKDQLVDPWRPESHGDRPAFTVKRRSYSLSSGGDYVRGSTVEELDRAALKYFSVEEDVVEDIEAGRSILFAQSFDYDSVKIQWRWPTKEEGSIASWWDMALVRSAFGFASTPNDGVTLLRGPRADFLVRSAKGWDDIGLAPIVIDGQLTPGRWYYYTLFFNVSDISSAEHWVKAATDWAQVPKDYRHAEHMWNTLPPFYRMVDRGDLQRLLKVIGFQLDNSRQFSEFVQDVYHTDTVPVPLLRQTGFNLGADREQGLGDIRFRALMANLAQRLEIRGTQKGLEDSLATMSQYQVKVDRGRNKMLLPDDADPYTSSGNWASVDDDDLQGGSFGYTLDASAFTLSLLDTAPFGAITGPGVGERGVLRATGSGNLLLACGLGTAPRLGQGSFYATDVGEGNIVTDVPVSAAEGGVLVGATGTYGFSVYGRCGEAALVSRAVLLWFDKDGLFLGLNEGDGETTATDWSVRYEAQATAPDKAKFLVPALYVEGLATYIDIAAAMVYEITAPGTRKVATPADRLLTLGVESEVLGEADPVELPDPFLMGKPGRGRSTT